jgi:hypothetical protein
MKNKKGAIGLGQITGIIMMLVVIGILLTVGLKVEKDLRTGMTQNSTEWNASKSAMEGLSNVAEQQGLLGTIIIFGVIIGVVIVAFAVRAGM